MSGGWREQSWIMAMWLCKSLEEFSSLNPPFLVAKLTDLP